MARRRENHGGNLVYQEGKCIEGEYYVVAVFDEPDVGAVAFSAYELENDCTYTYAVSYEEFDEFFKYNVELMNPSNMDARLHWVVERLDFVMDPLGQKQLCLSDEPTPEGADADAFAEADPEVDEALADSAAFGAEHKLADAASGLIDAQTRARLLKELDNQNFGNAQRGLVRSERARRKFLEEMFNKRQLEQLKAQQRLQKNDAERQERMTKLAEARRKQQEKSQHARERDEAQKATMQQLEVLKRQKQANDIRNLIRSRGDDSEDLRREENRERKRQVENAERERLAKEKQQEEQKGRNRETQVLKREQEIQHRDRQEAEKFRERREAERMIQVSRCEEKDQMLAEEWKQKADARLEKEANYLEFLRLEDRREEFAASREGTRAMNELQRLKERREAAFAAQEKAKKRREHEHDEFLLQWRVSASQKAMAERNSKKRTANRLSKLQERDEDRLRKFREQQFLESMRAFETGGSSMRKTQDLGAASRPSQERTQLPEDLSFAQQERARKEAESEARKKQDEAKKSKVDRLGAQNPNVAEVVKHREWKQQEETRKAQLETLRQEHETREDLARKAKRDHDAQREEQFKTMAPQRRANSAERRKARNEDMVKRIQNVPIGCGLPISFVY